MTKFANANVPFGTRYVRIGLINDNDDMEYLVVSFIDTPNEFGIVVNNDNNMLTEVRKKQSSIITDITTICAVNETEYSIIVNYDTQNQEYEVYIELA